MKTLTLLACAALTCAAPALGSQPPQAQQSSAPVAGEASPAAVAAADRLVSLMMPGDAFVRFVEAFAEQLPAFGTEAAQAGPADPHAEERTRLVARAVIRELVRVGGEVGPDFRRAWAGALARRMSLADIQAGSAFYGSPAGVRFASGVFSAALRPANLRALAVVSAWEDRLYAGMEVRLTQRIEAATAHLPRPGQEAGGGRRDTPDPTPTPTPAVPPREQAAPPAPEIEGPPADPVRLTAAQRVVAGMWPIGFERNAFVFEPLIETLLPMRVREFGVPLPVEAGVNPESTLGELFGAGDPHFAERARISARILGEELSGVMAQSHPHWNRIIADAYAREFTAEELDAVAGFLETPSGRNLIGASMQILQDRAFIHDSVLILPRVAAQLPAILTEVTAATAHLPPPPTPQVEIPADTPPSDGRRRRRPRN